MRGGVAHRGGRHPSGAHAVAVDAAHRLRPPSQRLGAPPGKNSPQDCLCPGDVHRPGVAPPNSLRSRCSLHSDSGGESVDEARAARVPTPCLHSSPPQKSPPPGAARREAAERWSFVEKPPRFPQRRVGVGWGARGRRREAQGFRRRAQRASLTDSSRLFEQRERSERREFSDGPEDRASQGSRCEASTASVARASPPQRAFAAPTPTPPTFTTPAFVRNQTT